MIGLIGWTVALLPENWARLFTSDAAVVAASAAYITRVAPFYCLFGLALTLYFASQGAGRMVVPVYQDVKTSYATSDPESAAQGACSGLTEDKRVFAVQVTDATDKTIQVRVLVSSSNSGKNFDLRCKLREGLLAFLVRDYPQALPVVRITENVESQEPPATGARLPDREREPSPSA